MKIIQRFVVSSFSLSILLASNLASACLIEIPFEHFDTLAQNKKACEDSLDRIRYEMTDVVNKSTGVSIQDDAKLVAFHDKDVLNKCDNTHYLMHPHSAYVEIGFADASGDSQALADGTKGDRCEKLKEKVIKELKLDSDESQRTVPGKDSARALPDNTQGTPDSSGTPAAAAPAGP
jgi:hypothetical protein